MYCSEALKELHSLSCFLKQNTSSERPESGKLNQQETFLREKAGLFFFLYFLYSVCTLVKHNLVNSAELCEAVPGLQIFVRKTVFVCLIKIESSLLLDDKEVWGSSSLPRSLAKR